VKGLDKVHVIDCRGTCQPKVAVLIIEILLRIVVEVSGEVYAGIYVGDYKNKRYDFHEFEKSQRVLMEG